MDRGQLLLKGSRPERMGVTALCGCSSGVSGEAKFRGTKCTCAEHGPLSGSEDPAARSVRRPGCGDFLSSAGPCCGRSFPSQATSGCRPQLVPLLHFVLQETGYSLYQSAFRRKKTNTAHPQGRCLVLACVGLGAAISGEAVSRERMGLVSMGRSSQNFFFVERSELLFLVRFSMARTKCYLK